MLAKILRSLLSIIVSVCVLKKKKKKMKQVRFKEEPTVHVMHVWSYASRIARCGHWEQAARDNARFQMRIELLKGVIEPVLLKKIQQTEINVEA